MSSCAGKRMKCFSAFWVTGWRLIPSHRRPSGGSRFSHSAKRASARPDKMRLPFRRGNLARRNLMRPVLVLGTRNRKKCQEIVDILGDLGLELRALSHFPDAPEVVEDGATFEANARK